MQYFSLAEYRDEYIHCLISQMFISISRDLLHRADRKEDGENLYLLFQNLRLKMLSNCQEEWTIERLCQEVNLEKSQFYVYYHHFFSTTPKLSLIHIYARNSSQLFPAFSADIPIIFTIVYQPVSYTHLDVYKRQILGHSNVNTTRIYTMESGTVHARQMERIGLIIT